MNSTLFNVKEYFLQIIMGILQACVIVWFAFGSLETTFSKDG